MCARVTCERGERRAREVKHVVGCVGGDADGDEEVGALRNVEMAVDDLCFHTASEWSKRFRKESRRTRHVRLDVLPPQSDTHHLDARRIM